MGRAAMLLVMGLSVVFGFIGHNVREASNQLTDTHTGYYKYSNARNLARLGIHRHLRYIDGIEDVALPNDPMTCLFNNGSYDVDTVSIGDTLTITSVGTYDTVYTIIAKLLNSQRPIPAAAGAIGVNTDLLNMHSGNPKLKIDGRNYDSTGTTLIGSGDRPGVAVTSASDSTVVAASGANIEGTPSITVNDNQEDPKEYLDTYKAAATYSFDKNNPPPNNTTFGSWIHPVIVVLNPLEDTTFGVTLSNITGYGMLIIEGGGKIKFSGNFKWYGMVMVYGISSLLDFSSTGNADMVGTFIVAGNDHNQANLKINGNANVKYSASALDKARKIAPLTYYKVVDWYEE